MPKCKRQTKEQSEYHYAMLRAEHEAYIDNRHYDIIKGIATRSMNKQAHSIVMHNIRHFLWAAKQNIFIPGAF